MATDEWFEVDEALDDVQLAFATVLRARATGWPLEPRDAALLLPHDDAYGQPLAQDESTEGRLLIVVDIPDVEMNQILLTVGAYLDRNQVTGDELHNQLYTLPARPSPLAFSAQGDPVTLGHRTSDWLEELLARPIVREEWMRSGKVQAYRWVLTGVGPIAESRDWTSGLGPPDRVVKVRGEPDTAE